MMLQKQQQQKKKKSNDENNNDAVKKEENPLSSPVVLKVDMHCDGWGSKILRYFNGFEAMKLNLVVEGVEKAKAKREIGKLMVTGNLEPCKLSEKLASKTNKKLNLLSQLPNKDKNKKSDNTKKPKEPPVTTVVLKVLLHCQGCIERIRKTVLKTKGVQEVTIDKEKEIVTVKGTMEAKTLAEKLMKRLKRKVEVVPPKKEKEKEKEEAEKNKEKEGAPNNKRGSGAVAKKKGGDDNREGEGDNDRKMKQSEMGFPAPTLMSSDVGNSNYYGLDDYRALYMGQVHAPQIFSDENPNACFVM